LIGCWIWRRFAVTTFSGELPDHGIRDDLSRRPKSRIRSQASATASQIGCGLYFVAGIRIALVAIGDTHQVLAMIEVGNMPKPLGQQARDITDAAANKVQSGIRFSEQTASRALDKAGDRVDELKGDAAPLFERVSDLAATKRR